MVFYFTLENAGGGRPHPERGRERGCRKGQNKADMVTRKTGGGGGGGGGWGAYIRAVRLL